MSDLSTEETGTEGGQKLRRSSRKRTSTRTFRLLSEDTGPKERKKKIIPTSTSEEDEPKAPVSTSKRKRNTGRPTKRPVKKSRSDDPETEVPIVQDTTETEMPVDDVDIPIDIDEEKGPRVGGADPIIITGPAARPDIALLTHDAQSQGKLEGDYLYQVLSKIRNNDLFADLVNDVAVQKPGPWATTVADHRTLPPDQQFPDEVLTRLGNVPDNVGVVVLDRSDFEGIEVEDESGQPYPQATYNSLLHMVDLGENIAGDLPVPATEGGGYWQYFKNTLFELCNAGNRTKAAAIDNAAAAGTLDCLSYTLACESLEADSEDRFDQLWVEVVRDPNCLTVIDEKGGKSKPLKATNEIKRMRFKNISTSRAKRLENNILVKHSAIYIESWKDNYADKYKAHDEDAYNRLIAWTEGDGQLDVDVAGRVAELTGINVQKGELKLMTNYVQAAFSDPQSYDPETKDDDTYGSTRKQKKKKSTKGAGRKSNRKTKK